MTATSPERKARIRDVLRLTFGVADGFARSCNKSSSLEAHHASGQRSVREGRYGLARSFRAL